MDSKRLIVTDPETGGMLFTVNGLPCDITDTDCRAIADAVVQSIVQYIDAQITKEAA